MSAPKKKKEKPKSNPKPQRHTKEKMIEMTTNKQTNEPPIPKYRDRSTNKQFQLY